MYRESLECFSDLEMIRTRSLGFLKRRQVAYPRVTNVFDAPRNARIPRRRGPSWRNLAIHLWCSAIGDIRSQPRAFEEELEVVRKS